MPPTLVDEPRATTRSTAPAAPPTSGQPRDAAPPTRAPRRLSHRLLGPPPTNDGAPLFWTLTLVVTVMTLVGLLMVLSASSVMAIARHQSAWYMFERQAVWALIGVGAYLVMARIDYHHWQRLMPVLVVIAIAGLVAVAIPHVGIESGGSRRWIGFGSSIGYQPSQVAKLVMLLFAASVVSRRAGRLDDWRRVLVPVLVVAALMAALVMLEPDLDAAVEIGMVAAAVLFVGGIPLRQLGTIAGAGLGTALVLAVAAPYRRGRLLTFLHPDRDPLNRSFQVHQSLIAVGSGGVQGVGLGAGHAKWEFLPAAHTDFIFAIIAEELGFLGCVAVLGLFALFAVVGCRIALRAHDRFGMLVAAGITAWICGQAAINIAMVVGLLPVTGTPLPFISAGGSSLVVLMGATGLLANVARQCVLSPTPRSADHPVHAARWRLAARRGSPAVTS
jgi:cell division protein FtsW